VTVAVSWRSGASRTFDRYLGRSYGRAPTRWGGCGLGLLSVISSCFLCFWVLARRRGLESNEVLIGDRTCVVVASGFCALVLRFEMFVLFRLDVILQPLKCAVL
jgi:hypothetical protein